jgi:hypothetical protein
MLVRMVLREKRKHTGREAEVAVLQNIDDDNSALASIEMAAEVSVRFVVTEPAG